MKLRVNGVEYNGQSYVSMWYAEAFPHDEWGCAMLNKGITFQDVFNCLQVGADFYAFIGAGDSVVRERVFEALATLMDCGYEHIYYQWLNHSKDPLEGKKIEDMRGMRFKNGNETATRILNFVMPYIPEHIKEEAIGILGES